MTSKVALPKTGFHQFLENRAVILKNIRCAYCGEALTSKSTTRDHVIGRRFVPKGKLNAQWNLILNACEKCNNKKSDLEDDIAAITLLPDPTGRFSHEDAGAMAEAARRAAKSISRRTGRPVQRSNESIKIKGALGPGVGVTFDFTGPPQIDETRGFELARLHLAALFFMQTYNPGTREGAWWLHGFHPIRMVQRGNWGNPIMRGFMTAIEKWECRLLAITADGFFKAETRLHPSAECWSWAVEWNHSHRLIGFFGEREPAQKIVDCFPAPQVRNIYEAPGKSIRYSVDTPLPEVDDTLFLGRHISDPYGDTIG